MKNNIILSVTAALSGVLLTLMIMSNSYLSTFTSPLHASWLTHAIGSVVALLIWFASRRQLPRQKENHKIPYWSYLGGIPGAFTVLLAAVTVNSQLSLSGSIVLMLTGQIVTGMLIDHLGFMGLTKRRITRQDCISVLLLFIGSTLIIMGK
nr:DMT family transporter [uncultured Moellerella sp.]